MKHLLSFTLLIALLVIACNNKNKKADSATVPASASEIKEIMQDASKKAEELQQFTPYTLEQIKELLPAELAGDSASGAIAYKNAGAEYARADYYPTDSTSLGLSIFDCGGSAGAGIYNTQFINQLNHQSGNSFEYRKTIDFNGEKAIEHVAGNNSSLVWLANKRLLVTLEGKGVEIDELKKIAADLDLKSKN